MALIPNPVNDMLQPLLRVEKAIGELAREIKPVGSLPSVHKELTEVNHALGELAQVNRNLAAVLEELRGLRLDLAEGEPVGARPASANPAPLKRPARREPRARAS